MNEYNNIRDYRRATLLAATMAATLIIALLLFSLLFGNSNPAPEPPTETVEEAGADDPAVLEEPPIIEPAPDLASPAAIIDDYLSRRNSPLAGYGIAFARAGYEWGINPYLLVALAGAESSFATNGSLSRTHHNAWGMKGPNKTGLTAVGGWMWWPDWPSAIDGAAYFVSVYWPGAQTAYDLRGYCEGNPSSWISRVEGVRGELGGAPWTR